MHNDAANVANDLIEEAKDHGNSKTAERLPPTEALISVNDNGKGKESDEDGAGGDGRLVIENAPFDGTDGERTVGVGTVGY